LSVLLDMPKVRQNTIHIGFMEAEDVSKIIPNLKKCGYIDIKPTVKGVKKLPIETSRTFNAKSFACEKGSYRNDLKKKNEMRSYGAVEADGEQELNGYISQDFFHSAPMMLNLLHNIILRYSPYIVWGILMILLLFPDFPIRSNKTSLPWWRIIRFPLNCRERLICWTTRSPTSMPH